MLNIDVGWGRGQIKVGFGVGNSLSMNLEYFEEELNTSVDWGRGWNLLRSSTQV